MGERLERRQPDAAFRSPRLDRLVAVVAMEPVRGQRGPSLDLARPVRGQGAGHTTRERV